LLTEENHLIKELPREAGKRLLDICQPIQLVKGGDPRGPPDAAEIESYFHGQL